MNISKTSRSLLESDKKIVTTMKSYGESLKNKALHTNNTVEVIIINSQEDNYATS